MQEVDRFTERQNKLKRVLEIVANRPDWLKENAELKQIVEEITDKAA